MQRVVWSFACLVLPATTIAAAEAGGVHAAAGIRFYF